MTDADREGGPDAAPRHRRHPWHLGPVTSLTPDDVGWNYCGLRILTLGGGEAVAWSSGDTELAVLPLRGSAVVETEGRRFVLDGRDSVFDRVTDWAYVPVDAEVRISSTAGAELAIPSARASRRFEPAYVAAADVAVEVRGGGVATRQVTNFMAPDTFAGADKLMCVELLTPGGNWSSYPPHRHDDSDGCPVANEEIYYFRIARAGPAGGAAGFALHRTYVPEIALDVTVTVGDGDVFVIPRGYHGPCVAAPGHALYYLNVLAGPGDERSMAFCDDPAHHWTCDVWATMSPDPRCPMTTAAGPVHR